MSAANNKILAKMLDRLFVGLMSGPNLNCRPHASRQRVDWVQLERFDDLAPSVALATLLGDSREVKLTARVPMPKWLGRGAARLRKRPASESSPSDAPPSAAADGGSTEPTPEIELTPEQRGQDRAWRSQQALFGKLLIVADEARTYEQDTGVHVLNVGFPLLSLPPGTAGTLAATAGQAVARRLVAPIAFVPVTITVRGGSTPSVTIDCKGDGVDLVLPNAALLAWLERQTGKALPDLFADEQGQDPWREINEIVRHVAGVLQLTASEVGRDKPLDLKPAPRADDSEPRPEIVPAAVLGLFPMNNQGLLRDVQAMAASESLDGPVQSFIEVGVSLDQTPDESYEHEAWSGQKRRRAFSDERFISVSDPCQSRAVRLARECRGLVIHGPPGTGKSQTITNIIGDHLARGQRVLMVCDKRTAMDVVANRLDHLGLGSLCALIHDPQRDQRDLYRAVREQLESLTEAKSDAAAERRLGRVDAELERLHAELTECWSLLMERDGEHGVSFHELVGEWLAVDAADGIALDPAALPGLSRRDFDGHQQDLHDLFERAERIAYGDNIWAKCAAVRLQDFLARPMADVRRTVRASLSAAQESDATADPSIPPFASPASAPLGAQGESRSELAGQIDSILAEVDQPLREHWAKVGPGAVEGARRKLDAAATFVELLRRGPLDAELALLIGAVTPTIADVVHQLATLDTYLAVASKWYGGFCWQRRSQAAAVLSRYGLSPGPASAERLRAFLAALRARLALSVLHREFTGKTTLSSEVIPDETLERSVAQHAALLGLLDGVHTEPRLAGLTEPLTRALIDPAFAREFIAGLRKSGARATGVVRLEQALIAVELLEPAWVSQVIESVCDGNQATDIVSELEEQLDTLEDVLRIRHTLATLPPGLGQAAARLLDPEFAAARRRENLGADTNPKPERGPSLTLRVSVPGKESAPEPEKSRACTAAQALAVLRKAVRAAEIAERLRASPKLQALDAQRMRSSFERYRSLDAEKRGLVRDAILHRWITRQQERLLVGTGSRLNSLGADLRRRLTMRGERAMRLRQVIAVGQAIAGGDPLFELRPVWMASPETVAQIFPRLPQFDVVVFDEASQCRLEEALPVLTRAKRVVIAGDPKQLPPTRFFETALATSEDEEIESEQQLFEVHQGEIEDLLGAALSIDIQQCYLDVHYRSRNSDLIEFSNEQFYSSRLQPIPAHPSNWARFAPITLYRVNGVYDKRCNAAEADQVCHIVSDLLKRAEPPSIGIACFNIAQRDLIVERLDELAAEDDEFARRLAEARVRRGAGSFEGLFVKNLENVQGDERDHMIISTTYGPDPKGRFYRRFGPLGRQGGGRRLNVLVTRAREEVHLATSIPAEVYRGLPTVPTGQAAGGGWLLFAYLAYAERLAESYEAAHEAVAAAEKSKTASVHVRPSRSPSTFSAELAQQLAAWHNVGSDVHWGNDGFCVDLALHHPHRVEDVTIGVLCDGTRFAQAEDPVEWDAFRTAILEGQGWHLHRLWTPHFFRDVQGCTQRILREAEELVATEEDKDALKVVKSSKEAEA